MRSKRKGQFCLDPTHRQAIRGHQGCLDGLQMVHMVRIGTGRRGGTRELIGRRVCGRQAVRRGDGALNTRARVE
jgi:hypothetical protein